jgi:hemolysin activation/secretion protein
MERPGLRAPAKLRGQAGVQPPPAGAHLLRFVLKGIVIKGATAFPTKKLSSLYAKRIGTNVTLEEVYAIADALSRLYQEEGYLLSRAYIPDQQIQNGIIEIRVIEGYVADVVTEGVTARAALVERYIRAIKAGRPAKAAQIETAVLGLGGIYGYSFRTIFSPAPQQPEGAVTLTLQAERVWREPCTLSADNFASRYTGPQQIATSCAFNLVPGQQTSFSILSGLPLAGQRMLSGTAGHKIQLAPYLTLDIDGGSSRVRPGYTIQRFDIDSRSTSGSVALSWQFIQQRDHNLSVQIAFDAKNSRSTTVRDAVLMEDRIRAIRLALMWSMSDSLAGYNTARLTLSQGLNALGASQAGDRNVSRAGARPDFRKVELILSRLQNIGERLSFLTSTKVQWTSTRLYSSEQAGYGGQDYGRAYDSSDLTADKGANASIEIRYSIGEGSPVRFQPYLFYDYGVVANASVPATHHASSAGGGVRFETRWRQSGNLGIAFPIGRPISTPIYGGSNKSPRLLFQATQSF